jgi:hypothetical protein
VDKISPVSAEVPPKDVASEGQSAPPGLGEKQAERARLGQMLDADAVHIEEDDRREQSGALVPSTNGWFFTM